MDYIMWINLLSNFYKIIIILRVFLISILSKKKWIEKLYFDEI